MRSPKFIYDYTRVQYITMNKKVIAISQKKNSYFHRQDKYIRSFDKLQKLTYGGKTIRKQPLVAVVIDELDGITKVIKSNNDPQTNIEEIERLQALQGVAAIVRLDQSGIERLGNRAILMEYIKASSLSAEEVVNSLSREFFHELEQIAKDIAELGYVIEDLEANILIDENKEPRIIDVERYEYDPENANQRNEEIVERIIKNTITLATARYMTNTLKAFKRDALVEDAKDIRTLLENNNKSLMETLTEYYKKPKKPKKLRKRF